jgi:hypothetical protein
MNAARRGPLFLRFLLFAAVLSGMLEVHAQSGAQVYGTIKDDSGGIITGASLALYSVDRVRELKSDADGRFAFASLPHGTYELRSQLLGFDLDILEGITVEDRDVGPLQIRLVGLPSESICGDEPIVSYERPPGGSVKLTGKVFGGDTSLSPIVDATLTLSREGQARFLQRSSETGDFHFDDVEPGEYRLTTQKGPYLSPLPADIWITRENLTRVFVRMEQSDQRPTQGCHYPVPVRREWSAQGSRGR